MKIKRNKQNTRTLTIYHHSFGFRQPYQVLCDGTLVNEALDRHVNIEESVQRALQAPAKLLITRCIVEELFSLGPEFRKSAHYAKQHFEFRRCRHAEPVSANMCIQSMINDDRNAKHFMVATQDKKLRHALAKVPGVPLLYMNNVILILEPPSEASRQFLQQAEKEKLKPAPIEVIPKQEAKVEIVKKKKKIQAPNPLSCKKKKTKQAEQQQGSSSNERKVRKRKRSGKGRDGSSLEAADA